jgi:hypothetical protein
MRHSELTPDLTERCALGTPASDESVVELQPTPLFVDGAAGMALRGVLANMGATVAECEVLEPVVVLDLVQVVDVVASGNRAVRLLPDPPMFVDDSLPTGGDADQDVAVRGNRATTYGRFALTHVLAAVSHRVAFLLLSRAHGAPLLARWAVPLNLMHSSHAAHVTTEGGR